MRLTTPLGECPQCGSDDVDVSSAFYDEGLFYYFDRGDFCIPMGCMQCDAAWWENYKLEFVGTEITMKGNCQGDNPTPSGVEKETTND